MSVFRIHFSALLAVAAVSVIFVGWIGASEDSMIGAIVVSTILIVVAYIPWCRKGTSCGRAASICIGVGLALVGALIMLDPIFDGYDITPALEYCAEPSGRRERAYCHTLELFTVLFGRNGIALFQLVTGGCMFFMGIMFLAFLPRSPNKRIVATR